MKRKRLLIILSIVLFITIIIVLSSEVFALGSVQVDYMSTTHNITATEQEIIESANIPTRKNVFMLSKQDYVNNIEKSNPYIKVVNIETIFPNKLVIHIVERDELFAVKQSGSTYYICDEQLKVLRVDNSYTNTNENAIELLNVQLDTTSYVVGEFLKVSSQNKNIISNVVEQLHGWQSSLISIKAHISQITINDYSFANVTLLMRAGATIKVYDVLEYCKQKFVLAFTVYEQDIENMQSGTILVMKVKNQDGTYSIRSFR